jgi:hypothetical protein
MLSYSCYSCNSWQYFATNYTNNTSGVAFICVHLWQKKTADHFLIGGQFGVILYQPSQGFIPYAGNGKQTEKFFISNSSSPVGDTERQYLF